MALQPTTSSFTFWGNIFSELGGGRTIKFPFLVWPTKWLQLSTSTSLENMTRQHRQLLQGNKQKESETQYRKKGMSMQSFSSCSCSPCSSKASLWQAKMSSSKSEEVSFSISVTTFSPGFQGKGETTTLLSFESRFQSLIATPHLRNTCHSLLSYLASAFFKNSHNALQQ